MLETKSRPKIPSGRSALAVLPGGAGTAEPYSSVSGWLGCGSGANPDLRWADCGVTAPLGAASWRASDGDSF